MCSLVVRHTQCLLADAPPTSQRRYDVSVKVAVLLLLLSCAPAFADLAAGQEAYDKGDYATALKEFLPLARQGNAEAQYSLGVMYDEGRGLAKDDKEAVNWYRLAAEQGYAPAQYNLGVMCEEGRGAPRDYSGAAQWVYSWRHGKEPRSRSSTSGYCTRTAGAFRKIRRRLSGGSGRLRSKDSRPRSSIWARSTTKATKVLPQDHREAMRWYRLAAEQGFTPAQRALGYMYQLGQGAPQDYKEAMRWYRLAAEQGDAPAQRGLSAMYRDGEGVPEDYKEAVRWARMAAEQGDADSQVFLGAAYERGKGVPQDYIEGARWLRLAAEQGAAGGQVLLAVNYEEGQGVPQDYVLAHMWYNLAGASGDPNGTKNRDRIARKMMPGQIAEAQRLAREWKPKPGRQ